MYSYKHNRYRIVAIAKDNEHEGQYTFEESYSDITDEIITEKFYNEFGTKPTEITVLSRERI